MLKRSGLRRALPAGVGVIGDLAYVGVARWHPQGLALGSADQLGAAVPEQFGHVVDPDPVEQVRVANVCRTL